MAVLAESHPDADDDPRSWWLLAQHEVLMGIETERYVRLRPMMTESASSSESSKNWDFRNRTTQPAATSTRSGSPTMPVFWTIQAQRHLRHALAEALGRESDGIAIGTGSCRGVLEVTLDHLNELLALTFEGASVVVKDQVIGYRRKKDLFILLVEAFGSDEDKTGPFVVKIGTQDRLEKEIKGWNRCRPPGLKHDLVFLSLRVGSTRTFEERKWMSLVYGDAQQFLGVTATVTFEEAALECVRSGFPQLPSIGVVINELFERIGHLLYSQGFVDNPAKCPRRVRPSICPSWNKAHAMLGERPVVPGRAPGCQRTGRQRRRTVSRPRRLPALPSGVRCLEGYRAGRRRHNRRPALTTGQKHPILWSCRDPE